MIVLFAARILIMLAAFVMGLVIGFTRPLKAHVAPAAPVAPTASMSHYCVPSDTTPLCVKARAALAAKSVELAARAK